MEKFYRIADITIQLSVPVSFLNEERYEIFEIPEETIEDIDYHVTFEPVREPEKLPEAEVDLGEIRYYRTADFFIEEYCEGTDYRPFRWLKMPLHDNIKSRQKWTCCFLIGYESRFCYIAQIFKHIGLNRMIHNSKGLMFHCSFIRFQQAGILFTGPSGIGKSTQANLWKRVKQADILNGDRAIIRKINQEWRAYGLPYAGSSNIFRNESAPIRGIVILRQADRNQVQKIQGAEGCRAILSEVFQSRWDPVMLMEILDGVEALLETVPVYKLECRPDESAVDCLYKRLQEDALL